MHDRATWHDFKPGPVQQTGNPLDVAIDGDAFLVVQTPRGERYTRNGAFQINATGQLVTAEGYQVLGDGGPIVFQTTDTQHRHHRGRHDHGARGRQHQVGRPRAANCGWCASISVGRLQKDGSSLFTAPAGVAPQALNPTSAYASSRARSSNRTCAAWSRCRA